MKQEDYEKLADGIETDYSIKNRIGRGLTILAKYSPDGDVKVTAEHDQIWAGHDNSTLDKMCEGDVIHLLEMGWFFDDDIESWSHFV